MNQLRRMVLVNSAKVRCREVALDGHIHFIGTQGTGQNLTAADTVIRFDPWWNPAAEAQATGRAYRIGQDKPVFVYKLIAAGTVEERVLQMQERKKGLIDGLFGDQKEALRKWNEDDLEDFFKPIG